MALEENGMGFSMPVTPMYGVNNGSGFGNGWGGDGFWIILLFILLGGWGNGYGNGGNGTSALYPWMNQSEIINDGFRDQMLNTSINGIQSAVTGGFSDVQMALCNGFAGVEAGANARQIADMQNSFALQSQLASCCCENRLGTADLKYTMATEACATRTADATNARDIIDSQTRGTQAILDKLCALELDGVKAQLAQACSLSFLYTGNLLISPCIILCAKDAILSLAVLIYPSIISILTSSSIPLLTISITSFLIVSLSLT